MSEPKSFRTFEDFHPFYLSEHTNRTSRRLHFVGTSIAAALFRAQPARHLPQSVVQSQGRLALVEGDSDGTGPLLRAIFLFDQIGVPSGDAHT
jgi:hypothetical protein